MDKILIANTYIPPEFFFMYNESGPYNFMLYGATGQGKTSFARWMIYGFYQTIASDIAVVSFTMLKEPIKFGLNANLEENKGEHFTFLDNIHMFQAYSSDNIRHHIDGGAAMSLDEFLDRFECYQKFKLKKLRLFHELFHRILESMYNQSDKNDEEFVEYYRLVSKKLTAENSNDHHVYQSLAHITSQLDKDRVIEFMNKNDDKFTDEDKLLYLECAGLKPNGFVFIEDGGEETKSHSSSKQQPIERRVGKNRHCFYGIIISAQDITQTAPKTRTNSSSIFFGDYSSDNDTKTIRPRYRKVKYPLPANKFNPYIVWQYPMGGYDGLVIENNVPLNLPDHGHPSLPMFDKFPMEVHPFTRTYFPSFMRGEKQYGYM